MVLMIVAVRLMRQAWRGEEPRLTRIAPATLALARHPGVAIFPFWWMLDTSLKRPVDIFAGVALCPQQPTFDELRPPVQQVPLRLVPAEQR